MRDSERWLVVDTETTGIRHPIYPVEIAAQVMQGWMPREEPFRVLVDFDVPIEPVAQTVHGYSREYLRKHGLPPKVALSRFLSYAGDAPIVAYNMSYDWNRVLMPTLSQAAGSSGLSEGFCALDLTRRVVPGLPDFKLKTVIKAFGLAKKQVHQAEHEVRLLVAFLSKHLGLHLKRCGVSGFDHVAACSEGTLSVAPLALPTSANKDPRRRSPFGRETVFAIGELVGIARMLILDCEITADRLNFLADWLERCPYAGVHPISDIFDTVRQIVSDGQMTDEDQILLTQALEEILVWRP
jgi:DNA polymerase III epsilon subunit-like protein